MSLHGQGQKWLVFRRLSVAGFGRSVTPVKCCPRCDGGDLSVELREPPWENYATSGSDASSEAAALDPEGPKEIAYCEQHNEH